MQHRHKDTLYQHTASSTRSKYPYIHVHWQLVHKASSMTKPGYSPMVDTASFHHLRTKTAQSYFYRTSHLSLSPLLLDY